jgi:hypothetical protein
MFGRVTTLQNVAVISCVQNTPVVDLWVANGDAPIEVVDCASTGAGNEIRNKMSGKADAATNTTFFMISATRFAASAGPSRVNLRRRSQQGKPSRSAVCSASSVVGAVVAGRCHSRRFALC